MLEQKFNNARFTQLKELLEIQYEKLYEYEKEIELADGISQKIALRQQMKRNLIPRLRETEHEYALLLNDGVSIQIIPEAKAQELVFELVTASNRANSYLKAGAPNEMLELLQKIKIKLEEPGKSAAAKLKIVLPIIPMIASYELELDTENFVLRTWRSIRSLFERLSSS